MGAMAVLRLLPMNARSTLPTAQREPLGRCSAGTASRSTICRKAYPEKSEDEIQPSRSTCGATWRGLRPNTSSSTSCSTTTRTARATAASRAYGAHLYERVAAEKKAHIIFTAHLGNFELLPVAGAAYGLHATAMFRPPNNPYIADIHPLDPPRPDGRR